MKIADLKGKKVTVMGLGLHGGGVGVVKFLAEAGVKVTVTDLKSKEELKASLEKLKNYKGIEYVLSQHRTEDFTNADMIIKTPPAPWNSKHIKLALEKKIPVEVDSSLFFKLCKNPIIGVTGTKGKTTTSSLIYHILKIAGKDVIQVGIGQTSVLDKLKELKKDTIVVFELSSWRLSALGRYKLSPHISVITNIYPDHLNYYKNMAEYIQDKKYICLNQKSEDYCIINSDDKELREMVKEVRSQFIEFSITGEDHGKSVFVRDGKIYFSEDGEDNEILSLDEIKLKGEHNIGNVLAAIGACIAQGINDKNIQKGVATFTGTPHRLELVRDLNGVKYYNDTAATTPESAISGIKSFAEPLTLIAGGTDKNLNMEELADVIMTKVKNIIFLKGTATDKILSALKKKMETEKSFIVVDSMEKAVELAHGVVQNGEVVLLSPGAASFGLFQNEFDRGDKFREAVKKLK